MGTYLKLDIYEDQEHVCTLLRTADGDLLAEQIRDMVSRAEILTHAGDGPDEYGMGVLPARIVAAATQGWEIYTQLIPQIDEEFDYKLRLDIPGRVAWGEANYHHDWRGKPVLTTI